MGYIIPQSGVSPTAPRALDICERFWSESVHKWLSINYVEQQIFQMLATVTISPPNMPGVYYTPPPVDTGYATPVWNPSQLGLINTIESVQRKFTKQLPGLSTFSYYERLQILQLQTLEHRRLQYNLQTCFNIVHGINCLESHDFFTMSSNSKTRGHPFRITVPIAKSNISRHFFSCRVVHP